VLTPGSNDRKYYLTFNEDEVEKLVYHAEELVECFGLNAKIRKYKGKRPIGLYRWDIEALYYTYSYLLEKDFEGLYKDKKSPDYQAMQSLVNKLKGYMDKAFSDY
jgi:hypothetical protein